MISLKPIVTKPNNLEPRNWSHKTLIMVNKKMKNNIFRYWGKTNKYEHHLLIWHCLDVAAVFNVILDLIPAYKKRFNVFFQLKEEIWRPNLVWLAALHDIGKFSPTFQQLVPKARNELNGPMPVAGYETYSPRHDKVGSFLLTEGLKKLNKRSICKKYNVDREKLRTLLQSATGHHGVPAPIEKEAHIRLQTSNIMADAKSWIDIAQELVGPEKKESLLLLAKKNVKTLESSWLFNGILILADWIGSDESFFPYKSKQQPLQEYWQYAKKRAKKAVFSTGIVSSPRKHLEFKKLFPDYQPSSLQKLANTVEISHLPQLFIIEDLTGSGKTEAALTLAARLLNADHAEGIFIALPTTTTSNAMFSRINKVYKRIFEKSSIVLAHGKSKTNKLFQKLIQKTTVQKHEETHSSWLANNNKKALLGGIGVGTIDQALLAILRSKHATLRLAGLAKSVLIVDEVHACDVYMNKLLQTLLTFHAGSGGSAILLSATLPKETRSNLESAFAGVNVHDDIDEYPLFTQTEFESSDINAWTTETPHPRTVPVKLIHKNKEAIDLLIQIAETGTGCWIRNTVSDAIEAANLLEKKGVSVLLFHSRFVTTDRARIEENLLRRVGPTSGAQDRNGFIVIATLVIEQSLDVDFDVMITDLAPIDLIIQRAGRMRRHSRLADGSRTKKQDQRISHPLFVLSPSLNRTKKPWFGHLFEKGQFVYPDEEILWNTAHVLAQQYTLHLPDNARYLIEAVYGDKGNFPEPPKHIIERANEAFGAECANKIVAHYQVNDFHRGFCYQQGSWKKEERALTRLGDPTITFRLLQWKENRLQAWPDPNDFGEIAADLRVRARGTDFEPICPDGLTKEELHTYQYSIPSGKWLVFLPLEQKSTHWSGAYWVTQGNKRVFYSVVYDEINGFREKKR